VKPRQSGRTIQEETTMTKFAYIKMYAPDFAPETATVLYTSIKRENMQKLLDQAYAANAATYRHPKNGWAMAVAPLGNDGIPMATNSFD
jgi:hypothetical protein